MSIRFLDFSQRRRVGFRGAFEFDSKHIMIASDSEIRILAYLPAIDATSVQKTIKTKGSLSSRSKSPNGRVRSERLGSEFGSPQSSNAAAGRRNSSANVRAARAKQPLMAFELARYTQENHPNE